MPEFYENLTLSGSSFMNPVHPQLSLEQSSFLSADTPISEDIAIEGISEATIAQYFQSLNAGDWDATSQLFAVDGVLQPPFESPLVGPDAIAAYLQTEAQGLVLHPHKETAQPLEEGGTAIKVVGKVQTSLFLVNVCWEFKLNPAKEILLAKINLLASLQELLDIRSKDGNESAKAIGTDSLEQEG